MYSMKKDRFGNEWSSDPRVLNKRMPHWLSELMVNVPFLIQVSDNHKLMVLLPNLRIYNGKDVTTTANHLRFVYSENLRTRV